jgi:hypothetical protein
MSETLFDRELPIKINLTAGGKKVTLTVRYPTDDELARRERTMKVFYKRGNSLPDIENQEVADLALATAIVAPGSDEVDENIASRLIELLMRTEIPEAPERTADGFSVGIKVCNGATTVHVLREPSEREIRKYRQNAIWMGNPRFGRQEAKTLLSAVGDFYDKLLVRVEGYPEGRLAVPINHKNAAVQAILTQINEEQEADQIDPENFSNPSGQNSPALGS